MVFAHEDGGLWTPGEPIVPCGPQVIPPGGGPPDPIFAGRPECNKCEILHLTKHIIDFIMVAAAPILAAFFFIWAGVLLMLGGAMPGRLAEGKRIFKDTLIGIIIVMLAWLITNTLIKSLAAATITFPAKCSNGVCSNGVGPCQNDSQCGSTIWNSGKWYEFNCPSSWQ